MISIRNISFSFRDTLRTAAFIRKGLICAALVLLLTSACTTVQPVRIRTEGGRRAEYGMASWYGEPFHGRLTANGEVYDMYKVSAAHKTLPLGSKVKVTHRGTGKSLVVRINDRGPFVRGRIIDMSYAAAAALGMVEDGVVPVRVETLALGDNRYVSSRTGASPGTPAVYTVQVGSFTQKENALSMKSSLEVRHPTVFIQEWNDGRGTFYRVRVGKFSREEEADQLARRLARQDYSPFVTAQ